MRMTEAEVAAYLAKHQRAQKPTQNAETGVRWIVRLPDQLQSENHFMGKHWRAKHRETKKWQKILGREINPLPAPLEQKQRITITRVLAQHQRLWDDGNGIGGSVKHLVDALKRLGWFHDDSPKWLEIIFEQDSSDRINPGCIIKLERVS